MPMTCYSGKLGRRFVHYYFALLFASGRGLKPHLGSGLDAFLILFLNLVAEHFDD